MRWSKFWPRRLTPRRERIYILPTRTGLVFFGFTVALLLMGAIYNSQLVNLMAFLLLTLYGLSMVMTHQNLQGLRNFRVGESEAFAREDAALEFSFENRDGAVKEGLILDFLPRGRHWPWAGAGLRFALEDAATEHPRVTTLIRFRREERGHWMFHRLRLSTRAPLGLFQAWRSEDVELELWVYPERREQLAIPAAERGEQGEDRARDLGRAEVWGDANPAEFVGSLRRLDWVRTARTDQAWVRPWNSETGQRHVLDWEQFAALTVEDRLSHFTFAIDQSLRRGDDLLVQGPWGARQVDRTSARELCRLFAEWPR